MLRVPLAFRAFEALPSALTDAAVQDFNDVFHDRLYPGAAALYVKSPASARGRLLDLTCDMSERETWLSGISSGTPEKRSSIGAIRQTTVRAT